MRVIIIRAKGMLGQELALAFAEYQPLLWDRGEIDITDEKMVFQKIASEKPDIVINSAAYNDVDGAENNWPIAEAINGLGPKYLSEAVNAVQGILVHFSTDYVFKGDKKDGYIESDPPNPQSAYARSKYLGERSVLQNSGKHYIIRLSRLFGKPAISSNAKKSFVDAMIGLANIKSELNVINEELSCPTYALDLARFTKKIIESKLPFGIYHGANDGACTWFEFCQEIFRLKGIKTKIIPVLSNFYSRPAIRPKFSILVNSKTKKQRSWQDALREYLLFK